MSNKEFYELEKVTFYDDQTQSPNPLRRWFHQTRQHLVARLVAKYYHLPNLIVDVGCGACLWNDASRYAVIGIDINKEVLTYAQEKGRIVMGLTCDLDAIPIESNSASIVVCSEVIEHLPNYPAVLAEIHRILKSGGHFITSVPYDTLLSCWKPLFFLQCLFQGYVRQDEYYKHRCGHINHFSPRSIRKALQSSGFKLVEQFDMRRFTIFTIGAKV